MSKKRKVKDKYTRDLEQFVPQYIAATGDQAWTTMKVAEWAVGNGLWEQRRISAIRQLARELSRVLRQVYITDESGCPVRKYHAFRLGKDQPMLWAPIEVITREQMDESKTMRRNTLAAGCVQLYSDLRYFNAKHNAGDPLLFDPDFARDIDEFLHPTEYPDAPPDDTNDTEPPSPPKG